MGAVVAAVETLVPAVVRVWVLIQEVDFVVAEEKGGGVDYADDKIGFFDGYDCANALPGGSNKCINCR